MPWSAPVRTDSQRHRVVSRLRSLWARLPGKRYLLALIAVAAGLTAVRVPAYADALASGSPGVSATVASIQRDWSYVPEYLAPALDTGRLTDASGHAVNGVTVIVFPVPVITHPDQACLAIARATTDAAGRFTVHLPNAKRVLLRGVRPDGFYNVHVIAFYPDAIANWFTPVQAKGGDVAISNLVLQRLPAQTATASAGLSPLASPAVASSIPPPRSRTSRRSSAISRTPRRRHQLFRVHLYRRGRPNDRRWRLCHR